MLIVSRQAVTGATRIAEEVAKRQAMIDDQQVAIEQEQQALKSALARCDRDERRWAEAYAAEVISLDELKIYRADLTRRAVTYRHSMRIWKLGARRCSKR
jgi:hypothetical protein